MAEEDNLNGLEQITGSPCDDIDLAEMFESDIGIRDEQNRVDDKVYCLHKHGFVNVTSFGNLLGKLCGKCCI